MEPQPVELHCVIHSEIPLPDWKLGEPLIPPCHRIDETKRHKFAMARRTVDQPKKHRRVRAETILRELGVYSRSQRKSRLTLVATTRPKAKGCVVDERNLDRLFKQSMQVPLKTAGSSVQS